MSTTVRCDGCSKKILDGEVKQSVNHLNEMSERITHIFCRDCLLQFDKRCPVRGCIIFDACPICLEIGTPEHPLVAVIHSVALPEGSAPHQFHTDCLQRAAHRECPLCRGRDCP